MENFGVHQASSESLESPKSSELLESPESIAHGSSLPPDFDATLGFAAMLHRAARTPAGIRHIHADGSETYQPYAHLWQDAQQIAAGLRSHQLQPGDLVILQLPHCPDFLVALWGCCLSGCVPVPVAVAPSYDPQAHPAPPLRAALQLLEHPTVLTSQSLQSEMQAFLDGEGHGPPSPNRSTNNRSTKLLTLAAIRLAGQGKESGGAIAPLSPDDLALLLLTSGSTGTPKGVMLSRRNLRVSAYGMATVNRLTATDITLNWMPLEHVASLVMFHFTEVYLGCEQIHVAHERVLARPLTWLDLLSQHRVTATWAPNFAYGLVNEQAAHLEQRQWDLSCVRWMGNGAEAVVVETTRRFLDRLAPYGLAATAVSPGYGLSETCSGIVHSHHFSADNTSDGGLVEVGSPIPGVSLRIVNGHNQVLPEGETGLLQVRGLAVTAGYYRRPDLTAEAFTADGWFNTGDLGFLRQGRLTITGRQKEVIILNGVNYPSHEIEAVVEELDGVAVSFTAACGVRRPEDASDQLAVFFHPLVAEADWADLLRQMRRQVRQRLGIVPAYLIPVEPAAIPKTAIGKIQRRSLSQRFAAGEFDAIVDQVKRVTAPAGIQGGDRPSSDLEQRLAAIWQQVLGLQAVGLHDNFFDLGGNSLKLMQVLQQVQAALAADLTAVELFQYPTVAALARRIGPSQAVQSGSVQVGERQSGKRPQTGHTEIAVIGMAGRFPGASNLEAFWQNLRAGVESITFFTPEEMVAAGVAPSLVRHPNYVNASPTLDGTEYFDADFFGYSPKEAELMDPQHRLLLECAWESLEHAGYDPLTYAGPIGLFAGAAMNTYLLNHVYPNRDRLDPQDPLQVFTLSSMGGFQATVANDKDYLTTRISYKLNLRGPSINVQTACSTSLVAVHLAAQSLLAGECAMALAGGVSVQTPQKAGHLFQEGMILSPDGHCRAFDAQAQGTIFGSGVGLVVLKRLEQAIADRDTVYAVIKGSAVGNDGGMKVGYFAPRSEGQATVAATAMAIAGVEADSIQYLEAHGTGTPLGDPIEIAGLTQAFRTSTQARQFCAIGSVKTNVGHLNIASGIVGLLKTVLALHHQKIPPSLHFNTPNPQIDFANSPFYVNTTLADWPTNGSPRRAGVNSLGIGGTNVHVVLEESGKAEGRRQKAEGEGGKAEGRGQKAEGEPGVRSQESGVRSQESGVGSQESGVGSRESEISSAETQNPKSKIQNPKPETQNPKSKIQNPKSKTPHLLPLSAKTPDALRELVARYQTFLAEQPDLSLADLCFTASVGRSHFNERLAIVTHSLEQLQDQIYAVANGQSAPGVCCRERGDRPPTTAFLFTGQGSQFPHMGQDLYQTYPTFQQAIDRCTEILAEQEVDLLEALHQQPKSKIQNPKSKTQPSLFALEYALAQLWLSWGIQPTVVMGHSLGEYVAACIAGVFSLEDALMLVAARGQLMEALPTGGAMASVMADESQVRAALAAPSLSLSASLSASLSEQVAIAAINGPQSTVISGPEGAIARLMQYFASQGIKATRLNVSHAFHSPLMQPMLAEFERVARRVTYHPPQMDLVSNLTGAIATDDITTPDYWCRHILQPVQFAASVATLRQLGVTTLVECGPRPVLLGLARTMLDSPADLPPDTYTYLPSLHPDHPDSHPILTSLATLYVQGITPNWSALSPHPSPHRIPLPTYPFQRQRHWLNPPTHPLVHRSADFDGALGSTEGSRRSLFTHPLLGHRIPSPLQAIFTAQLSPHQPTFLTDHRVNGAPVFPATAYVEMALAAGTAVLKSDAIRLRTVALLQPMVWHDEAPRTVQTILQRDGDGARFQIFSAPAVTAEASADLDWTLHCEGAIAPRQTPDTAPMDLTEMRQRLTEERSPDAHYQACQRLGLDYGPSFRSVQQIWRRDGEALGQIQCPAALMTDAFPDRLHPAGLDACCQMVFAALPPEAQADPYLPIGIDCLRYDQPQPGPRLWSHVKLHPWTSPQPSVVTADVRILDDQGRLLVLISGLSVKRVNAAAKTGHGLADGKDDSSPWRDWLYRVEWCPMPLPPISQPATATGHWLILADETGLADALAQRLQHHGQQTTVACLGDGYARTAAGIQLNPRCPDDFRQLVQEMGATLSGIVSFWGLETDSPTTEAALPDRLRQGCETTLYLVQAIASCWPSLPYPRLWLITCGAQAIASRESVRVAQSPLWGLGRVTALEHPELGCVRVDLDPEAPQASIHLLAAELRHHLAAEANQGEDQIAFRQGNRYGARLVGDRSHPVGQTSQSEPANLQLQIQTRGTLEHLTWQPGSRRAPTPDEVEIQVHVTGLNFRDVMNALGLYPGEAGALGLECVGQIVTVGSAVPSVRLGDWVMAIAPGSFSQFVTVPAAWVTPKPAPLSLEAVATLPVAFLTAAHALGQVEPMPACALQKGQRILIHAAAGGVGQAAVQLAQRAGAEVFATASPGKWDWLKAQGVAHVMNSRSLDFADEILRATGGQGVDFVLNALSGDFIPKSLAVLKPGGCFVEIGKAGIWTTEQMSQHRPDVTYRVLDLLEMTYQQPERIQAALVNLARQFEQRHLQPLPHQSFTGDRAIDAFRTLQQAHHIGKVLIEAPPLRLPPIRANATYLITGGLGALGLQLAQWLVQQGARHLLLLSRRPPTPAAQSVIQQLQHQGAAVHTLQADVADLTTLQATLALYLARPSTHSPLPPPSKASSTSPDSSMTALCSSKPGSASPP